MVNHTLLNRPPQRQPGPDLERFLEIWLEGYGWPWSCRLSLALDCCIDGWVPQ